MSKSTQHGLRVLFLPKYPEEGASSRYRVYQFLPYLRSYGIEGDVSPFYTAEDFRLLGQSGQTGRKAMGLVKAVVRRFWALRQVARYDLVYFQREALPLGPLWIERLLRTMGVPMVFDLDDALFIFRPNRRTKLFNFFKSSDRIGRIIGKMDAVCAANEFIAEYARQSCTHVYNIPGAEDMTRYEVSPLAKDDAMFSLGWIGSPSTEHYLELIKPDLKRLAAEIPNMRFVIVGGRDFECDGVNVVHLKWSLATELAHVRGFDVGLMPLPDNEWSRGKCGGKGRVYMAAGVTPVVTAIGYNLELIKHGETGILVQPGDDWVEPILDLYRDPDKRAQIAANAQEYVRATLSIDGIAPRMARMLHEVAMLKSKGREQ